MQIQSQTIQLSIWAFAILLFGFVDTLTSLLVFSNGGREANVLMVAVLSLFGSSVWGFLLLKLISTSAVVLISRTRPGTEGMLSLAMLFVGLYLVLHNSTLMASLSARA